MALPRQGVPLSASLPDGYVEIDRWDIGRVSSRAVVGSIALGLVALLVTSNLAFGVLYLVADEPTIRIGIPSLLIGMVLGLVLHELSHAAGFVTLGGHPKFGARGRTRLGPIFYVSSPGYYYSRRGFLFAGIGAVIVLAVLLLGVVAVAPAGGVLSATAVIAVSLNVAGAAGDALIARAVLSYPPDARFEDAGEGFVVYGPEPRGDRA